MGGGGGGYNGLLFLTCCSIETSPSYKHHSHNFLLIAIHVYESGMEVVFSDNNVNALCIFFWQVEANQCKWVQGLHSQLTR